MSRKKLKILLFGDPLLRQTAKPVTVFHKKLHAVIDSIAETLNARDDGAALAATQVGIMKRIIVIDYLGEYLELINPEILEAGGEETDFEGCLSYPGYTGRVPRSATVKVKYFDRNGKEHLIERNGRFARCIQHEVDHLNGILYIDRMREMYLTNSLDQTRIDLDSVLLLSDKKKEAV
jgi:peptide deformylase